MAGLFSELKRRNVVRVGLAYIVVGWVTIQIAQLLFEAFGTPDWVIKTVIVVIAIGFPFALLFAWAFELTPEGLKKTREVDLSQSITHNTGRKLDFIIIGALVLALGYFIWERQAYDRVPASRAELTTAALPAAPAEAEVTETESRSIAVLPFVNMSSDEEQEYFADGLTEEILNSLVKTPDLLVAARTSSFAFKGSNQPIPEIAASLGVDHVLEGSVRRGGETLRITAQLIRADDGFHLWSQTYDRTMEDVIAIQEEIAINIARALETAMDPEALAEMMSVGTSSVEAYEALLKSRGVFGAANASGDIYEFLRIREYIEQSVAADPNFSAAHHGLYTYWNLMLSPAQVMYGITEMPRDEMRQLRDSALARAIETARDDVDRTKYRAQDALQNFDYRLAARLAESVRASRPSDIDTVGNLLEAYRALGMNDEVLALVQSEFERGDNHGRTMNWSLQSLRRPEDRDYLRSLGHEAIEMYGDREFTMYQAHRALLWAGDIDGASMTLPQIRGSRIPEENRLLVELRQACAENKLDAATDIREEILAKYPDEIAARWLANTIYGDDDSASAVLLPYDESGEFDIIADFLAYAHFDPSPYPEFMERLSGQGIEERPVFPAPYRCSP